jgi:N-acetylglucosaminyldiphosphoundecaprenol N-acetyl-beta-D-mannosaminyltransferase
MSQKIVFQSKIKSQLFDFLKSNNQRKILNFLNLHDLYQAENEPLFRNAILGEQNLNFIDGFIISAYLSLTNMKRVPRLRGPTFTRDFLSDKKQSANKTHFFIGIEKEDLEKLKLKFPHLKNISSYNPPYIKGLKFPKEEIGKIATMINKSKADYVWIGVGCPKQNILSIELYKKTNAQYFVNIGAALDFLLGKKEEAPLIVRELGMEWLYRLVTDFKYSKKKVWRSLVGIKNLGNVRLQNR